MVDSSMMPMLGMFHFDLKHFTQFESIFRLFSGHSPHLSIWSVLNQIELILCWTGHILTNISLTGSVYAIGDVAFCLGFAIGPALSGTLGKIWALCVQKKVEKQLNICGSFHFSAHLVTWFGFNGLCSTTALVCFIFSPFMYLLKKPPGRNENQTLLEEASVRYVNYTNEESPEEEPDMRKTNQQWVPWSLVKSKMIIFATYLLLTLYKCFIVMIVIYLLIFDSIINSLKIQFQKYCPISSKCFAANLIWLTYRTKS